MSDKPNIVIIMTDQQQARATAREGCPVDTTPFLDKLARRGKWFDRAYTAAPLCRPARVSMLTGRYPGAHGVRANPTRDVRYEKDLVDVLAERGYLTAMVGKNHSHLTPDRVDHWFGLGHAAGYGTDSPRTGEEEAFDQWLKDLRHGVAEQPSPGGVEVQGPCRAVTDACGWVGSLRSDAATAGRPFFMWLTFAEPHNPFQAPEPYFSMFPLADLPPTYGDKSVLERKSFKWQYVGKLGRYGMKRYDELLPRQRTNYYGMLRLIDDQVRRLADWLEAAGELDNTLIFFVSDHGDFVADYGLMRKGPEMPEDLMRIPFLAVGPGIEPGGDAAHPAHVSLVDLMPTICEAVGAPIPDGVQGRSLWPVLTGGAYPDDEFASAYAEQGFGGLDYDWDDEPEYDCSAVEAIHFDCLNQYTQCGIMRMIRQDDWKLVFDMQGKGQLYNLADDPGELNDLFDEPACAPVRHRLVEGLLAWTLRAQDPLPLPGGTYQQKNHPRNYWKDGAK